MKTTTRINSAIIIFTFVIIVAASYVRTYAANSFKSQGMIVYTNGTSTTRDDVIFDAEDFQRLASVCK